MYSLAGSTCKETSLFTSAKSTDLTHPLLKRTNAGLSPRSIINQWLWGVQGRGEHVRQHWDTEPHPWEHVPLLTQSSWQRDRYTCALILVWVDHDQDFRNQMSEIRYSYTVNLNKMRQGFPGQHNKISLMDNQK